MQIQHATLPPAVAAAPLILEQHALLAGQLVELVGSLPLVYMQ